MAALAPQAPIGVAVSGGADSMAALHLTIEWCRRRGLAPPFAATIDHGLRKESRVEAQRVAEWTRMLGAQHSILRWEGSKPAANIQAAAREARYALLGAWARALGIKTVITGHTLDDQAETFLIRLARGSGLDGLSGMAPSAVFPSPAFDELMLARPLLGFSHQRLVATLRAAQQDWIEDPSNDAVRFTRTQMRAARAALEGAGLTTERLAETAGHLRRAREAIEASVETLIESTVDISPWGYAIAEVATFGAAPAEVALRALARLVAAIGGETYAPRFEMLEAVWTWLLLGDEPKGRTLGGCRLVRREDGTLLIAREMSAIQSEVSLKAGESEIWDGRFRVSVAASAPEPAIVKPLGAKGLAIVGPRAELPPVEPRLIAATTPALWTAGALVAAPLCGFLSQDAELHGFSVAFLGLAKGKGAAKGNSL